jgi:hypothetical protein
LFQFINRCCNLIETFETCLKLRAFFIEWHNEFSCNGLHVEMLVFLFQRVICGIALLLWIKLGWRFWYEMIEWINPRHPRTCCTSKGYDYGEKIACHC